MASVTDVDGCRVGLIAVDQRDAVKIAAKQQCHGVRRAVRHTCIHHLLLVSVPQTPSHLAFVSYAVTDAEDRGVYGKKRISQPNIVSASEII